MVDSFVRFLARPNGGIELEFSMSAIEFMWGLTIIICPSVLETSQAFSVFWWHPLPRLVGVPWLFTGGVSIVGILGFLLPISRSFRSTLRVLGATLASILWWTLVVYTQGFGGSLMIFIISIVFAMAYIRILAGVLYRMTQTWPLEI